MRAIVGARQWDSSRHSIADSWSPQCMSPTPRSMVGCVMRDFGPLFFYVASECTPHSVPPTTPATRLMYHYSAIELFISASPVYI